MTEPLKPMTVAECDEFDARLIPGEPLPSCDVRCIDRLLADHAKMRNALNREWHIWWESFRPHSDDAEKRAAALQETIAEFCADHGLTEADCIAWNIFDGEST